MQRLIDQHNFHARLQRKVDKACTVSFHNLLFKDRQNLCGYLLNWHIIINHDLGILPYGATQTGFIRIS